MLAVTHCEVYVQLPRLAQKTVPCSYSLLPALTALIVLPLFLNDPQALGGEAMIEIPNMGLSTPQPLLLCIFTRWVFVLIRIPLHKEVFLMRLGKALTCEYGMLWEWPT